MLVLSVLAALVGAVGSIIGVILKDWILTLRIEIWKEKRLANILFKQYKDPLLLSAFELTARLDQILNECPPDYLCPESFTYIDKPDR